MTLVVRIGRTDDSRDEYIMMWKYSGPVKAVIFDWAGTTVDHGSLAPVRVMQQVFDEARCSHFGSRSAPRYRHSQAGSHSKDSVRAEKSRSDGATPSGRKPIEADVEIPVENFVPLQLECMVRYSVVIDGVAETGRATSQTRDPDRKHNGIHARDARSDTATRRRAGLPAGLRDHAG